MEIVYNNNIDLILNFKYENYLFHLECDAINGFYLLIKQYNLETKNYQTSNAYLDLVGGIWQISAFKCWKKTNLGDSIFPDFNMLVTNIEIKNILIKYFNLLSELNIHGNIEQCKKDLQEINNAKI